MIKMKKRQRGGEGEGKVRYSDKNVDEKYNDDIMDLCEIVCIENEDEVRRERDRN